jgi:hypothetical protein
MAKWLGIPRIYCYVAWMSREKLRRVDAGTVRLRLRREPANNHLFVALYTGPEFPSDDWRTGTPGPATVPLPYSKTELGPWLRNGESPGSSSEGVGPHTRGSASPLSGPVLRIPASPGRQRNGCLWGRPQLELAIRPVTSRAVPENDARTPACERPANGAGGLLRGVDPSTVPLDPDGMNWKSMAESTRSVPTSSVGSTAVLC